MRMLSFIGRNLAIIWQKSIWQILRKIVNFQSEILHFRELAERLPRQAGVKMRRSCAAGIPSGKTVISSRVSAKKSF